MKGLPQIIFLMFLCMEFGAIVALDGKPRDNWSIKQFSIGVVITLGLLFWGGYFDVLLVVFK
jgi:hypothetical protein